MRSVSCPNLSPTRSSSLPNPSLVTSGSASKPTFNGVLANSANASVPLRISDCPADSPCPVILSKKLLPDSSITPLAREKNPSFSGSTGVATLGLEKDLFISKALILISLNPAVLNLFFCSSVSILLVDYLFHINNIIFS